MAESEEEQKNFLMKVKVDSEKVGLKLNIQKAKIMATGSKLVKEYVNIVYCHPAYLTYIQSTSCEMPGG